MKLTEKLLSELAKQAQAALARKPARWIELSPQTVLALIAEVELARLIDLRFERKTETAMIDHG